MWRVPSGSNGKANRLAAATSWSRSTTSFDGVSLDVDNVPTPILDALKGLIFADDAQVTDLLCRKRNVKLELDIERPSPLLLTTFDRRDQFLHIQVADAPTQEVAPW